MASQAEVAEFVAKLREAMAMPRKIEAYLEALTPFPAAVLEQLRLKLVRAEIAGLKYDIGPNPAELAQQARNYRPRRTGRARPSGSGRARARRLSWRPSRRR